VIASDERALVFTTDFFTPIVDDPFDFGAVAAANALSDVYAMGGGRCPRSASWLSGQRPAVSVLSEILRGGALKAKEAGIDVVGGHTIKTDEPIYGLGVVGEVQPQPDPLERRRAPRAMRSCLTKPLGIGVIADREQERPGPAPRHARGDPRDGRTLNKDACDAMLESARTGRRDRHGLRPPGPPAQRVAREAACRARVISRKRRP
jgi:selenium donor protein